MIEKIKEKRNLKSFNNCSLGICFLVFFCLLRLSPMMYDGWAGPYYYINYGGLLGWWRYVTGPMRDYINGRVASNFFCGILESYMTEIPLDIAGSIVLVGIIYCLIKIFDIRNNYVIFVYTALIILMPYGIRTYIVQIALLQYVTPILFLMLALLLFKYYNEKKENKYIYYLWILSVISCAWMENTSVAYGIVITVLCIATTIKEKKVNIRLWITVFCSLFSGFYMVSSKGMQMSRGALGSENSFLILNRDVLLRHLHNFNVEIIFKGALAHFIIAFIFGVICLSGFIYETKLKKKIYLASMLILNAIISGMFLVLAFKSNEVIYTMPLNEILYNIILNKPIWFLVLLLLGYFLWIFVNVCMCVKSKYVVCILCLYGIVLLGVVLPTNQIGGRIIGPFYFILVCLVCVVVGECQNYSSPKKNIIASAVLITVILSGDYYTQLCNRLLEFNRETEERIETLKKSQHLGEWNMEEYFILPKANVRDLYLGAETTIGTFHYPQFLYRKGLDSDTKVMFRNQKEYVKLIDVTEQEIKVEVCNVDDEKYSYIYILSYCGNENYKYVDVMNEGRVEDAKYSFPILNGSGYYKVTVYLINNETGAQELIKDYIEVKVNI